MIPRAYVTKEYNIEKSSALTLSTNWTHSTRHVSAENYLVARALHDHSLFHYDNSQVHYPLEEVTRNTSCGTYIKTYQEEKHGRSVWSILNSQYDGDEKRKEKIKVKYYLLHTCVWNGQSNFTLEKFISQHWNNYVSMHQCAEHFAIQLPKNHAQFMSLIYSILYNDALLH